MRAHSWEILLPAGFGCAAAACCVAAVTFPEPVARVGLVGVAVALFGAWARHYLAAPLTGLMSWCFVTGFLVHTRGELAFASDDLVRLAELVAVAVAGCALGHVRHARRLARARPGGEELVGPVTAAPVRPGEPASTSLPAGSPR
ncbi:hypothetical protein ACWEPC_35770 [Nonomuraea sp. NPDC004297]